MTNPVNIPATICALAKLQAEIDALDGDDTERAGIVRAGLEGVRGDVITNLYAACHEPAALPAALPDDQAQAVRRDFARRVAVTLAAARRAAPYERTREGLERAITVILTSAGLR